MYRQTYYLRLINLEYSMLCTHIGSQTFSQVTFINEKYFPSQVTAFWSKENQCKFHTHLMRWSKWISLFPLYLNVVLVNFVLLYINSNKYIWLSVLIISAAPLVSVLKPTVYVMIHWREQNSYTIRKLRA